MVVMSMQDNRKRIVEIDRQILDLLSQRFEAVKNIGIAKREQGAPVLDTTREDILRAMYVQFAEELGLDETFVIRYLDILLTESKRIQYL